MSLDDHKFHLIVELDGFKLLPKNWDGYGSDPLNPEIIEEAKRWLHAIAPLKVKPHLAPMSPGGVQFEWDINGQSLEIEFASKDQILYLKWVDNHPGYPYPVEDDFHARDIYLANKLLAWVGAVDMPETPEVKVNLPEGCKVVGSLDGAGVAQLDQDLMLVRLPSGASIDVGWYPDEDPDGQFCVHIKEAGDEYFREDCEKFFTRSLDEVVAYVERKAAEHASKS